MTSLQKVVFDLKAFCQDLSEVYPEVLSIHLFGSRRYGGGSLRSDIDLFVEVDGDIKPYDLRNLIEERCPALDIFLLRRGSALSVVNETYVEAETNADLLASRDALCLWSRTDGFTTESEHFEQRYAKEIEYRMTVLPNTWIGASFDTLKARLAKENLPTDPVLGETTGEVVDRLLRVAERVATFAGKDFPNAGNDKRSFVVTPSSEADLQDIFWICVKPWVADAAREAIEVQFDGQRKKSDFSFGSSRIIIEMKLAKTKDDARAIAKTLDGLSHFYKENANVTYVVFVVYFRKESEIDAAAWEGRFSRPHDQPRVRLKVVRLD